MLVPLHEDGMKRPVEVLARADPRRLDRRNRIENRAGADRQTRGPQGPREIGDVVCEAAFTLAGEMHRSLGCPQRALNLIEHVLGAAALHLLDVVLVLQENAERVRDERRIERDRIEFHEGRGPVEGFGDARCLEQVLLPDRLNEGDDLLRQPLGGVAGHGS